MDDKLIKSADKFISNRLLLEQNFKWQNGFVYLGAAGMGLIKNQDLNVEKMKAIKEDIKKSVSIFSSLRGNGMIIPSTMLSFEDNPKEVLDDMIKYADEFYKYFKWNAKMYTASYFLATISPEFNEKMVIDKTNILIKALKKEFFYLDIDLFSSYCTIAANTQLSVEQIVNKIKECYEFLKVNKFKYSSAISLSFIFMLLDNHKEACIRFVYLHEQLRKIKLNFGKNYECNSLAILSLLESDDDKIISSIVDTTNYLKEQPRFGFMHMNSTQRLVHATTICIATYTSNEETTDMISAFIPLLVAYYVKTQESMVATGVFMASASSTC